VNVLPTSPYSWLLHSGGTSAGTIALLIEGKLTTNDDVCLSFLYFPLLCVLSMVAITFISYHWLSQDSICTLYSSYHWKIVPHHKLPLYNSNLSASYPTGCSFLRWRIINGCPTFFSLLSPRLPPTHRSQNGCLSNS
jgi:hypothetical protein